MNPIFKKILSAAISTMLLISAIPTLAMAGTEFKPEDPIASLNTNFPASFFFYHDSEHEQQIESITEMQIGQKVYYEVVSAEGYYCTEIIGRNFPYLDRNYFIYDGNLDFSDSSVLAGDFDNNGKVNSKDAMWILRYCAQWNTDQKKWTIEENMFAGDYYIDAEVNMKDAAGILRMLVGLDEPYGGVQKKFDTVVPLEYETGEQIATHECFPPDPIVVSSAEDFQDFCYLASLADVIYPEFLPDDYFTIRPDEKYPLNEEALCAKYDEEFFKEHNIIIGSIATKVLPTVEFESFELLNGYPTVVFRRVEGGVILPDYSFNQIIIIDKDTIQPDTEIKVRSYSPAF